MAEAVGPLLMACTLMMTRPSLEKRQLRAVSTHKRCARRKSMPMIGKDTSARRKGHVKRRPASCTAVRACPQHAMLFPAGPVRRGPDGGRDEEWGMTLKAAPVSMR